MTLDPTIPPRQDIADPYQFWHTALAGTEQEVHEDQPQCGFWRRREKKDSPLWSAIATWEDPVGIVGTEIRSDGSTRMIDVPELWTYFCQNPVTYEAYQQFKESHRWPDDAPEPPAAGHNRPPELDSDDPFTRLSAELKSEHETVYVFLGTEITTQDQADQVGSWVKRLTRLGSEVKDAHKLEKDPHLSAGREVDDKWRDLKPAFKDLADHLRRHADAWMIAQKRAKEAEVNKKLAEAAKLDEEADKATVDQHEDLKQKAADKRKDAQTLAKKGTTAGRTGAKMSVREVTVGTVEDYDKAHMAFKDHPEMKNLITRLAQQAAKAGVPVDGVKIEREERTV